MSPALFQVAFGLALLSFALNYALGLGLQLGLRWHPRPLHHALYFLTCAGTLAAGVLAALGARPWWPLAALLGLLLLVPRTRPGRADHALLATLIGAGFAGVVWGTALGAGAGL